MSHIQSIRINSVKFGERMRPDVTTPLWLIVVASGTKSGTKTSLSTSGILRARSCPPWPTIESVWEGFWNDAPIYSKQKQNAAKRYDSQTPKRVMIIEETATMYFGRAAGV
jgi:hypothetical protein